MSKHPLVLSAEVDLLNASRVEATAKHAAEEAMRVWVSRAKDLGAAESRLHYVRKYLQTNVEQHGT